MMRKRDTSILFLFLLLFFLFTGCSKNPETKKVVIGSELKNAHFYDSKILGEMVLSSVREDGKSKLYSFNLDGTLKQKYAVDSNWIYALDEGRTGEGSAVLSSNQYGEINLLFLNEDGTIKEERLLTDDPAMITSQIKIDPILIRDGEKYLIAFTTVDGRINNNDPKKENGTYTIHLYRLDPSGKLEKLPDILEKKQNLEDGDLIKDGDRLMFLYEKEEYDKGPSEIRVRFSDDHGMTWKDDRALISNGADNEPATLLVHENGYSLYYSSDVDHPGTSYSAAKAYRMDFDKDLNELQNREIPLLLDGSILLYDVRETQEGAQFLYSRNYVKDDEVTFETIKNWK